jgi:hypothetical protein
MFRSCVLCLFILLYHRKRWSTCRQVLALSWLVAVASELPVPKRADKSIGGVGINWVAIKFNYLWYKANKYESQCHCHPSMDDNFSLNTEYSCLSDRWSSIYQVARALLSGPDRREKQMFCTRRMTTQCLSFSLGSLRHGHQMFSATLMNQWVLLSVESLRFRPLSRRNMATSRPRLLGVEESAAAPPSLVLDRRWVSYVPVTCTQ